MCYAQSSVAVWQSLFLLMVKGISAFLQQASGKEF